MAIMSDQILDAVLVALNGPGKPVDLTVEDHTAVSLEPEALPYGSVRPSKEEDEPPGTRIAKVVKHRLEFVVALWAEGLTPRKALSPLIGWTVQALLQDPSLGGLVHNLEPISKKWYDDFTDENRGLVELTFSVSYATNRSNEEVKI